MAEEYVIMPKADYVATCNAIRTKTGKTAMLKSDQLGPEILSIEGEGSSGGCGGNVDTSFRGMYSFRMRVRVCSITI